MKSFPFIIMILLGCLTVMAQPGMEDVIYLKNGNVYRGVIFEQVPGQYYNMQTIGGNIFKVESGDVSKITKEPRWQGPRGERAERSETYGNNGNSGGNSNREARKAYKDSLKAAWVPRTKGYFFQGQLLLESLQGGIRLINGYKFGRYGHLGFGIGVDFSGPSILNAVIDRNGGGNVSGIYLPMYLYYGGDILKRKITPFYAVELGYTVGRSPRSYYAYELDCIDCGPVYEYGQTVHGPMGGGGIGVRFNTNRRLNFSVLFNVNFKSLGYSMAEYYYDEFGNYYQSTRTERETVVYPGFRLGIGF